jgi:chromosomal replication initiator protein
VATYFRLSEQDIVGQKRAGRINHARQVAMYLMRELTEISLSQIGEYFGGRSHTTVLHGCNKVAEETEHDTNLSNALNQLASELKRG